MKALLLITVGLLALTAFVYHNKSNNTNHVAELFDKFTAEHNKVYTAEERVYRLSVFAQNFDKVAALNSANDGAVYALNKFADLTAAEFKATYLGVIKGRSVYGEQQGEYTVNASDIDWTDKGDVQAVKDQGQCGSCWAFSAIGAVESEDAVHGSGLGNFSEQQLVDCSRSYGNYGCNGGLMDYAFKYIIDHGITTESAYPYRAVDQKCKVDGGDYKIKKFTDVRAGDVDGLTSALQGQPISVAVDAMNWQFYSSGIFSNCGKSLDHGVLLVGVNNGEGSLRIKNSWGTSWGEKGFIRLKLGNTCGVAQAASWPTA